MSTVETVKAVGCVGDGRFTEAIINTIACLHSHINGRIWTYNPEHERPANSGGTFRHYSDIQLPKNFFITNDTGRFMEGVDVLFVATTSQRTRENLKAALGRHSHFEGPIVSCCKGIEKNTNLRISEVIAEVLNVPANQIIALSGPNYADDLMQKKSMQTVLAGNTEITTLIKKLLRTDFFDIETTEDIIGVELCGAIKNVIAIMGGIVKELFPNSPDRILQLTTNGIEEMKLLLRNLEGNPETVDGIAGIGDLKLTMLTTGSRNEAFGRNVVTKSTSFNHTTVEGRDTTSGLAALGEQHGISLPITYALHKILESKNNLKETELHGLVDPLFSNEIL